MGVPLPDAQAAPQIAVRLTLFADLRRYLPRGHDGARSLALEPGATVATLLAAAGIPPDERITIGLNGELGQRDALLADGDEVALFSPMAGG